MKDYRTEIERNAYNRGVIARINGLTIMDCPYSITHNDSGKDNIEVNAWIKGYAEKGSIK